MPTLPPGIQCGVSGNFFEVPMGGVVSKFLFFTGLTAACYYANKFATVGNRPYTLAPTWVAEAAEKGNVAERTAAPPVFLDPIRHGLPGGIRGPEDLP